MDWAASYTANIKELKRAADKGKAFKGREGVGQGSQKQKKGLF